MSNSEFPPVRADVEMQENTSEPPVETSHNPNAARRALRVRNQEIRAEAARKVREERARAEEVRTKQRSKAAKKAAETKKKHALEAKLSSGADSSAGNSTNGGNSGDGSSTGSSSNNSSSNKSTNKSSNKSSSNNNNNSSTSSSKAPKASKSSNRQLVKLKYGSPLEAPPMLPIAAESTKLFWLRANLREFLLRFDKICRLPTRLTSSVNDLQQPWVPEQMKPVILSMLKLIASDQRPLWDVREYITNIDALEPRDERIWDWLLQFVEQAYPFAPTGVPETEEEQLELLRVLSMLCTGTESIRVTITSDVEQLKYVEKDAQDEIKQITAKFKDTQGKLAKLKSVDPQVYKDRLAAAQRAADNKVWKVQQQLYVKMHKYNMRTAPVATDILKNRFWALQYRSPTQAAWGSWIVCEMMYDPELVSNWYAQFSGDISSVVKKRDEMLIEKANERKKIRKEKKEAETTQIQAESSGPVNPAAVAESDTPMNGVVTATVVAGEAVPPSVPSLVTPISELPPAVIPAVSATPAVVMPPQTPVFEQTTVESKPSFSFPVSQASAPDTVTGTAASSPSPTIHTTPAPKRKYPKLKISFPEPFPEPKLYYVEGRENIMQLSAWIAGFSKGGSKSIHEIDEVAEFLAQ